MKKKFFISAGALAFVLSLFVVTICNAGTASTSCNEQFKFACKDSDKVCYFTLWENDEKCVFDNSDFKFMSGDKDNGI